MKSGKAKEKPVDRRIQKTKNLLSGAFINLIIEKGYDAITIQDIIDKANVGRSTFYAHFENKEQLLRHDNFRELIEGNVSDEGKSIGINFLPLFQHMGGNVPLAKALLGKKGGEIITDHLKNLISHRIAEQFKKQMPKGRDEKMFIMVVHAASSAIVTLITNWLEMDKPFSPEEMAEKSQNLLLKMFK